MDHEAIARDIVQAVNQHAVQYNLDAFQQWRDQYSDYLREYMPYDVRILEPRDYDAEEKVSSIVDGLLKQAN